MTRGQLIALRQDLKLVGHILSKRDRLLRENSQEDIALNLFEARLQLQKALEKLENEDGDA